ncbi:MAG TPA: FAD-binding oxidoreductase [Thermoleophilaceae bacterium]|nr:FAD-binding oxidoreductase [Thermoleophilaceae bacterium]
MTVLDNSTLSLSIPGDDRYDAARQAFNLTLDQRPAMIAEPTNAEQVAAVVRFAAAQGYRVAPQATGHNAAPLGSLEDTVLLKTRAMQGVEIDVAARRARVLAGSKWEQVTPRASELGLAALHGSSPDVGVVGYSLGGGMGWYARKHGLQTNSVTAIELVNAGGELIRVDHDTEPELFWALRGGGGNFGVVTAIEFDLFPLEQVYAGTLFFPFERASEVMHAWHEWTDGTPDEVTSTGKLLQFPPLPEIPEPVRGKSFTVVSAAYLGDEAEGAALMAPLRELGPVMDTFAMVPPVGLSELAMDPPDPVPYASTSQLLRELPASAIDDLVEAVGPGSDSRLVMAELRQTGGALSRTAEHHGALASLEGRYAQFAVGVVMDEATAVASNEQLGAAKAAIERHQVGQYLNFAESATDLRDAFAAEAYARLQAAKASYDPEGRFQANHEVTAAA